MVHDCSEALPLTLRQPGRPEGLAEHWRLPLQAHERSQLRGRRVCQDGQVVLLQLPRQEPLRPGEWLLPAPGGCQPVAVEVVAAQEELLEIRAATSLALLQAAYHLGNRHVAMEIHTDELRLLRDSVLAQMLEHRGLAVEAMVAPFYPESGAYGHSHSPGSDKSASDHQVGNQPATDGHPEHEHGDHQHPGHSHSSHSHSGHSHTSHSHASDGQVSHSHSSDQHGDQRPG